MCSCPKEMNSISSVVIEILSFILKNCFFLQERWYQGNLYPVLLHIFVKKIIFSVPVSIFPEKYNLVGPAVT